MAARKLEARRTFARAYYPKCQPSQSVFIFSILRHPCFVLVYYYLLMVFYLSKQLF